MNYQETLEYIESLKVCGIVPGLDSIRNLCAQLGNPQEQLFYVHIAGTNGKGSVLAYVSTILSCAGYKVGRYLSPVIFDYCEKIQINGKPISKKAMGEYMTRVREACERMTAKGLPQPTPFEVETAAAFLYFQEKKCDIVVLETGMGGSLDATNLITRTKAAVITSVSMDHMQFLGDTIEKIAAQKAGIIKNGCYSITLQQEESVLQVLAQAAARENSPLTVTNKAEKIKYGLKQQSFSYETASGRKYEKLLITLAGKYQIDNAALAIETIEKLGECGYPVSEKMLRKGLLTTTWHARFQVIGEKPCFVIDGAHNEDAAEKLAQSIRFYFTNRRIIYIMGVLRDKEYEKVIAATYSYAEQIITVTPPKNPRALSALELASAAKGYHPHVTAAGSLEEAVEMAYLLARKEDVIISFGSLSYLGQLTHIVQKQQEKEGKKSSWIKKK